jgi:hypothetical protein
MKTPSDRLPKRKSQTFYLSPKNPSIKRTMTTNPTSQMILFMGYSSSTTLQRCNVNAGYSCYCPEITQPCT